MVLWASWREESWCFWRKARASENPLKSRLFRKKHTGQVNDRDFNDGFIAQYLRSQNTIYREKMENEGIFLCWGKTQKSKSTIGFEGLLGREKETYLTTCANFQVINLAWEVKVYIKRLLSPFVCKILEI